jgi:hypothetical protein
MSRLHDPAWHRERATRFAPGDRVARILRADPFGGQVATAMYGTVLRVHPTRKVGLGGVCAYVTVRWDNGHEGRVEDRWLLKATEAT